MIEKHEGFEVNTCQDYDWPRIQMLCDVMFMQRPFTKTHLDIARLVKSQAKPLVLDYDDDLLCVPESNPTFAMYGTEQTKATVMAIIKLADAVTVSTEQLARKIRSINERCLVQVIPNSMDFKMFGYTYAKRDEESTNLVMWRGSKTHDADVMHFIDPLMSLVEKHQKYTFHFQGGTPWFLTKALSRFSNTLVGKPIDPFEYFDMISTVRPSLWLVPLEDTEFNRSKSNIAWLEAVMSGSVAVCPDWEEWQVPGALNYKDPQSFYDQADAFLSKCTDPREMNEHAWNHVIENLDLELNNRLRAKLFHGLVHRKTQ